jgi:Domain of unknown function (DUF222)
MSSICSDGRAAAFDALDAALEQVSALRFDTFSTTEKLCALERLETARRRLPVAEHALITGISAEATPAELGEGLAKVLANRLRITKAEAARRISDAEVLAPRQALTGEPLAPVLAATAAGQRAGEIGAGHIREIRRFLKELPAWADSATRERIEADLARLSRQYRPDEVRQAAERIAALINPDGDFVDEDRARKRGIIIGRQDVDGMSPIRGWLTPELRAGLDAVLAKWAAPGMCNPDDQSPTLDGNPSEEAIQRDFRSRAQRNHDALGALCRGALASGELGNHGGLPVSIVVSTTLQELESAAGVAITGGGSWLPMSDLIRMASHAHHYLTVFDKHASRPLYLGATKRIATPAQRIVLHATDRGCTFPGCDAPGYRCEVHHVDEWAAGGLTNADKLTFACKCHHRLVDRGWTTRKRPDGTTEWIPPPHLDFERPTTNDYHHPQRYLRPDDDEEDEDGQPAA